MATKTEGSAIQLPYYKRVMARLEDSDEAKVKLFGDKAARTWQRKVKVKTTEIEKKRTDLADLLLDEKEKLADLMEEYTDAFLLLDTKKIDTTEDRNRYVDEFTYTLQGKKNKILGQEQRIEDLKKSYEKTIKELEEEIGLLKEFLSVL